MKFQKGDLVWIGWCPNEYVLFDGRLLQGEVIDYYDFEIDNPIYGPCLRVRVDANDGVLPYIVPEPMLTKIPPEEHGRHEEEKDKEPAEAV